MKLFLGKACPPFAFFNKVNGGRVNASNNRQRVAGNASLKCASNVNDLSLGQLVSRRFFASQINKTCSPLMFAVFRKRNPFKVFRPVIQLVAVNVVNRQPILKTRNKSNCNKPMQRHFWALISNFCRHFKIPSAVQSWGQNLFFVYRDKMLACPVFVPSCKRSPSRAQDASIFTNNPVNIFLVNIYFFHAVNNTAQHG